MCDKNRSRFGKKVREIKFKKKERTTGQLCVAPLSSTCCLLYPSLAQLDFPIFSIHLVMAFEQLIYIFGLKGPHLLSKCYLTIERLLAFGECFELNLAHQFRRRLRDGELWRQSRDSICLLLLPKLIIPLHMLEQVRHFGESFLKAKSKKI